MLSKSSLNPEARIVMLREQTNLFLFDKNVLVIIVLILISKDAFEPSYNGFKIHCLKL